MQPSPTVRRRWLASELRRLRDQAGLTLEQVADAAGVSTSTVSRIETRQTAAKIPVVKALLDVYSVTGSEADRLLRVARDANQKGWWQSYSGDLPEVYQTLIGMEAEATRIETFHPLVIPGVLQAPGYATAVRRAVEPTSPDEVTQRIVDIRLERQQRIFANPSVRLHAVICEEVLLRPVGGVPTMRDQVAHLIDLSTNEGTTVQVLPVTTGAHPGVLGPFVILQFDDGSTGDPVVFLETAGGHLIEEAADRVGWFRRTFDIIAELAESPDASRRRMRRAMKELR